MLRKGLTNRAKQYLSCLVQLRERLTDDTKQSGDGVQGLALGVVQLEDLLELVQSGHGLSWLDARHRRPLGVKTVAELDYFHNKELEGKKAKDFRVNPILQQSSQKLRL